MASRDFAMYAESGGTVENIIADDKRNTLTNTCV
jgi:hypothetical protein